MNDVRFAAAIRAARTRRGWRQADLAQRSGVGASTVSRIELGQVDGTPVGTLRKVAHALEIRVELLPRSRSGDLDRMVSARHSALAEEVVALLERVGGWVVRPEVSFSIYGERGIVDLVAWHPARKALLVTELKTEIVDVGELLGTFDRKRRLAREIVRDLRWRPASVSTALIVGDGMTNRRRIRSHAGTFSAALPDDARALRRWLRDPVGEVRALTFVSDNHPGNVRTGFTTVRRVRPRGGVAPTCNSCGAKHATG